MEPSVEILEEFGVRGSPIPLSGGQAQGRGSDLVSS